MLTFFFIFLCVYRRSVECKHERNLYGSLVCGSEGRDLLVRDCVSQEG